jgi:hypothetical protein
MKNSEDRLLDQIELENGLTVFLYDRSKPIAGDRCQVRLLAMVPVPLSEWYSSCRHEKTAEIDEEFIRERGEFLVFQVEKTRNFIAQEEVSVVLEEMKRNFLVSGRSYLGHRNFAQKFLEKNYEEWKRNREWQKSYAMALAGLSSECER